MNFFFNERRNVVTQQFRRHKKRPIAFHDSVPRHDVEEILHVTADRLIRRKETEIGINLRGRRVVVPCADVYVTPHPGAFTPHHETELRVNLESGKAVNDVDARAFQLFRPVDVLLFVKTRLQFHDGRHLLAATAGFQKALYNRRTAPATIKRLFDGDDIRIQGRLLQKMQDAPEGIVGVVHHLIAFGDRRKHVRIRFKGSRNTGLSGRVLQRRFVRGHNRHEFREPQRHPGFEDLVRANVEMFKQEFLQAPRAPARQLKPHDGTETALLHVVAHGGKKIVGFVFFNFTVRVAGHAKESVILHAVPREKRFKPLPDQIFHEKNLIRVFAVLKRESRVAFNRIRHEKQPRQIVRTLQPGKTHARLIVRRRGRKFNHKVQTRVGNHRKGAPRIHCLRRQNRQNLFVEITIERLFLLHREFIVLHEPQVFFRQRRPQFIKPQTFGDVEHPRDALTDFGELLRGRHLIRPGRCDAASCLPLQVHDAHHIKLVKVIKEDREKLHPIKEGDFLILRRLQNLTVKFNPADFTIEIPRRIP